LVLVVQSATTERTCQQISVQNNWKWKKETYSRWLTI
jgi:hypothetical protein